jgi:2-polyprenyl-3-methyl-5-hydroxy-6-metoxy-1,4-benzoquinol methylase
MCDSPEVESVLPLGQIPVVTPNVDAKNAAEKYAGVQAQTVPLGLYVCRGCGHLQLLDVVNPEVQYNNFNYVTSISLGLPEHFIRFAGEIIDAVGAQPGALVLEVGSNDGTLLRAFKERGMKVLGVDPAQKTAARATASGIETLATFYTEKLAKELRAKHGPAQIVIANNTFANLDNLADFAAAVRASLAPSGVFVFETQYGADVVEKTLIDTVYHEHLSYFMARPLDAYFARHGLELIDLQRIWTKGGSIRGTVQLAGGPRQRSASVDALIADEKKRGYDGMAPFRKLAADVAAVKQEVAAMVEERRKAGKRFAGYGASVGTVTLIQQFQLGQVLEFIADDKPLCEQIASADYRIPVLPPEAIYERKPDAIIVLAWRYTDPIVGKHQRFLAGGGEFIIPLPKASIRSAARS